MTTQTGSKRQLRALGAFQLALALGSAVLFTYAVHGSLAFNSMHLPGETRMQMHVYLPEGWKFFTRDPQSADALPWTQNQDGTWRLGAPGSYQGDALGFNREVRALGLELGMISTQVPEDAYKTCDGDVSTCLSAAPVSKSIANISPRKTLCGHVGIVQQRPVPWAWTRSGHPVVMPSRVAMVEVKC